MQKTFITIARKSFFSCGVYREDCGNSGFNYCLEVYINGPIDPLTGLVINLSDVKQVLAITEETFDQKHLNYDIQLKTVDLNSIHKHIHSQFMAEFNKQDLQDIKLVKSILFEGKSRWSEIST